MSLQLIDHMRSAHKERLERMGLVPNYRRAVRLRVDTPPPAVTPEFIPAMSHAEQIEAINQRFDDALAAARARK